jgi:hypothetical protein
VTAGIRGGSSGGPASVRPSDTPAVETNELGPLSEKSAVERGLSAEVRRRFNMPEVSEDIVTERQVGRTGVCSAGRLAADRTSEFDPLCGRTVAERRLSVEVRPQLRLWTDACLVVRSTVGRVSARDPLKEMRADAGRPSTKVRRYFEMPEVCEDIVMERKPRRTGACLVVRSTVGRVSARDPLKEMRADAGRPSTKVRR